MPDIELRLGRDMLTLEGTMSEMLTRQGVSPNECIEFINVLDPEIILDIHRYYKMAGAECAVSNTFAATRAALSTHGLSDRMEELNIAGVELAKYHKPEHILAAIGPCTLDVRPALDAEASSQGIALFGEVYSQYADAVRALASAGPDAIYILSMQDIADACAAVLAARQACDLPVFVSCLFDETGRMPLSSTDPTIAAAVLEAAGACAVGADCGGGPEEMFPVLEQMTRATALPVIARPDIDTVSSDTRAVVSKYAGSPNQMADWAEKYRSIGVQFVGTCCGSTPAYAGAIRTTIGGRDVVEHGRREAEVDGRDITDARDDVLFEDTSSLVKSLYTQWQLLCQGTVSK